MAWRPFFRFEQFGSVRGDHADEDRRMSEATNPEHEKNHHPPKPYWRRAHTDWKFWVAVVALAVAITIYVMTVDLSMVPR